MTLGLTPQPFMTQQRFTKAIGKSNSSHEKQDLKNVIYTRRRLSMEDLDRFGRLVSVVVAVGLTVIVVCFFACLFICSYASSASNINVMTTDSPRVEEEKETSEERRQAVIAWLFPIQQSSISTQMMTNTQIALDTDDNATKDLPCQLATLISSDDLEEPNVCSICLESIEENMIVGGCLHRYHQVCIMKWMTDGHDNCPNCRQLMWDQETFDFLEKYQTKYALRSI